MEANLALIDAMASEDEIAIEFANVDVERWSGHGVRRTSLPGCRQVGRAAHSA